MSALLYGVGLQWKMDIRNKGILLKYYIVPLVFFAFMGGIFSSINPTAYKTLIQSMTIFGVTMGAVLGSPTSLVELFGTEMKKAYTVAAIPLWSIVINNFISAFIHLMIMSVAIFLIAPIAFHASAPENVGVYFISLLFFIVACLCVGTLLGLYVKSTSRLTMVAQFVFLPSIMLSGIMFPTDMLPNALQYVAKLLPATWGYINICNDGFVFTDMHPLINIIIVATVLCGLRLHQMKK